MIIHDYFNLIPSLLIESYLLIFSQYSGFSLQDLSKLNVLFILTMNVKYVEIFRVNVMHHGPNSPIIIGIKFELELTNIAKFILQVCNSSQWMFRYRFHHIFLYKSIIMSSKLLLEVPSSWSKFGIVWVLNLPT